MNRKHLIRFVVSVGAVLALYFGSYGPVQGYYGMYLLFTGHDEETDLRILETPDAVYFPIFWLCSKSRGFDAFAHQYTRLCARMWTPYFMEPSRRERLRTLKSAPTTT
jgi:hypothetical protein